MIVANGDLIVVQKLLVANRPVVASKSIDFNSSLRFQVTLDLEDQRIFISEPALQMIE
jgi:hypothetical protein